MLKYSRYFYTAMCKNMKILVSGGWLTYGIPEIWKTWSFSFSSGIWLYAFSFKSRRFYLWRGSGKNGRYGNSGRSYLYWHCISLSQRRQRALPWTYSKKIQQKRLFSCHKTSHLERKNTGWRKTPFWWTVTASRYGICGFLSPPLPR